jgi:7-carboxy-7-deazaguanine synthase
MSRLKLTEIFFSIQGEADAVGWPTVFVRLTGCPLRCTYCDTEYAFYGGNWHEQAEVLAQVASYGAKHVCVTGGEPLAQKGCVPLLAALCNAGYNVSLETSGAMDIRQVDARVARVVDIKTPGSGEVDRNLWGNLDVLSARDQVKFVICHREDYEWARSKLAELNLCARAMVLFSPSATQLPASELADWILADRLSVRLQIQLHKVLWGNVAGK